MYTIETGRDSFPIPVHHGKVKYVYYRQIQKILALQKPQGH